MIFTDVLDVCIRDTSETQTTPTISGTGSESAVMLTIRGECHCTTAQGVCVYVKGLEDLEAEQLPVVGVLPRANRKHYVTLCLINADGREERVHRTKTVMGSSPLWEEAFELYVFPCLCEGFDGRR